jgi:hypothetical protein
MEALPVMLEGSDEEVSPLAHPNRYRTNGPRGVTAGHPTEEGSLPARSPKDGRPTVSTGALNGPGPIRSLRYSRVFERLKN